VFLVTAPEWDFEGIYSISTPKIAKTMLIHILCAFHDGNRYISVANVLSAFSGF